MTATMIGRVLAGVVLVTLFWVNSAPAADRDALLNEPGLFGTFATFRIDHDWWEIPGDARVVAVSEVRGLIDQFGKKILIDSYLLRGLSDHGDFMFRVHAKSLSDTQQFLVSLLGTRFGRHLVETTYFHGLTKTALYIPGFSDQMKTDLKTVTEPGGKTYVVVIPIRKDADWWGLDPAVRAAMMQEHTLAALPYVPAVRRKLYHSSGLDDIDFLTYFETDKLEEFQGLIRALQQVKEYRHDRQFGRPTLVGTIRSLDDILELFAR